MAKVRFQQNVLLPPSAWGVINKQVYESSVCLEDFRKIHNSNGDVKLLPSATITRDLRRRFYGVLLFEKRDSKPVVREWCGENTGSYVKTVRVKPLYPKGMYFFLLFTYSIFMYSICVSIVLAF